MLEYLKNSIWSRIFAFSLICSIISVVIATLTEIGEVYIATSFFLLLGILALIVTVYLCLKRILKFGALISICIFFVIVAGVIYCCNIYIEDYYLDMCWRYSLVVGGISMLIQIFLLFFGKKTSDTTVENTTMYNNVEQNNIPQNNVQQNNAVVNQPMNMNNQQSQNVQVNEGQNSSMGGNNNG